MRKITKYLVLPLSFCSISTLSFSTFAESLGKPVVMAAQAGGGYQGGSTDGSKESSTGGSMRSGDSAGPSGRAMGDHRSYEGGDRHYGRGDRHFRHGGRYDHNGYRHHGRHCRHFVEYRYFCKYRPSCYWHHGYRQCDYVKRCGHYPVEHVRCWR